MKRLLCALFTLAALLSACAGAAPSRAVSRPLRVPGAPELPPAYSLSARLEAFRGEEQTSCIRFSAVRTDSGLSYAASTGERYLFLRQGEDAYALYIWDSAAGAMVPNQDTVLSARALAGFQRALLPLDLLLADTQGLARTGEAVMAGRPCQVFTGADSAGDAFSRRQTCWVDQETGLALFRRVQYLDQAGQTFIYQFTCEAFSTSPGALSRLPVEL